MHSLERASERETPLSDPTRSARMQTPRCRQSYMRAIPTSQHSGGRHRFTPCLNFFLFFSFLSGSRALAATAAILAPGRWHAIYTRQPRRSDRRAGLRTSPHHENSQKTKTDGQNRQSSPEPKRSSSRMPQRGPRKVSKKTASTNSWPLPGNPCPELRVQHGGLQRRSVDLPQKAGRGGEADIKQPKSTAQKNSSLHPARRTERLLSLPPRRPETAHRSAHLPPPAVSTTPSHHTGKLGAPRRIRGVSLDLGGVGVGAQALSAHAGDDVHEASVVLHALLRPGVTSSRQKTGPRAPTERNTQAHDGNSGRGQEGGGGHE